MEKLNKKNKRKYNLEKLLLELVVVFLGVTGGFLLNNWRMENQEKLHEQKYISGFSQDIQQNIDELENRLETDSIWLQQATPIVLSLRDGKVNIDSAEAAMKLIIAISKMEANTGTYEDITNSGNLNIISDFQLKSQIVAYHMEIHNIKFIDDYFYQYFSDFVMPFVLSEFSVLNGKFVNPDIIKTVKFSNVMAGYFSMIQQRKSAYKGLYNKSHSLKKELNSYIKESK